MPKISFANSKRDNDDNDKYVKLSDDQEYEINNIKCEDVIYYGSIILLLLFIIISSIVMLYFILKDKN